MNLGVDVRFRLCRTSLTAKGEASGGREGGFGVREDVVQSSEDSILKMVCLKLSSPQTNTPMQD